VEDRDYGYVRKPYLSHQERKYHRVCLVSRGSRSGTVVVRAQEGVNISTRKADD
jgi:hypothetical protein